MGSSDFIQEFLEGKKTSPGANFLEGSIPWWMCQKLNQIFNVKEKIGEKTDGTNKNLGIEID